MTWFDMIFGICMILHDLKHWRDLKMIVYLWENILSLSCFSTCFWEKINKSSCFSVLLSLFTLISYLNGVVCLCRYGMLSYISVMIYVHIRPISFSLKCFEIRCVCVFVNALYIREYIYVNQKENDFKLREIPKPYKYDAAPSQRWLVGLAFLSD